MNEIILTGLVGLVTTIVSWFLAKKKYNSEVDGNLIENLQKSLEFYDKLSSDNKQRLEKAIEENKVMREDLTTISTENNALRLSVETLTKENESLKKSVSALTKENKELGKSVEDLRKQVQALSDSVGSGLTKPKTKKK